MVTGQEIGSADVAAYDTSASLIEILAREVFAGREDAYPIARRLAVAISAEINARIQQATGAAP